MNKVKGKRRKVKGKKSDLVFFFLNSSQGDFPKSAAGRTLLNPPKMELNKRSALRGRRPLFEV